MRHLSMFSESTNGGAVSRGRQQFLSLMKSRRTMASECDTDWNESHQHFFKDMQHGVGE